jgi:hypothetical protein
MKIYNVFWSDFHGTEVYCGSFSNEVFAREYIDARNNSKYYTIEEAYVDNP